MSASNEVVKKPRLEERLPRMKALPWMPFAPARLAWRILEILTRPTCMDQVEKYRSFQNWSGTRSTAKLNRGKSPCL